MAQKAHSARFPGESSRYRTARNRLLAAETAALGSPGCATHSSRCTLAGEKAGMQTVM